MICAIQASTSVEKIMDWLLKGGLYIVSYNKFFGMDVYTFIKYRKVKAPWKVILYGNPVLLIVLAINRVIEEYAPDTHLYNVSFAVTLTIGGVYLVISFIAGYINKKRS